MSGTNSDENYSVYKKGEESVFTPEEMQQAAADLTTTLVNTVVDKNGRHIDVVAILEMVVIGVVVTVIRPDSYRQAVFNLAMSVADKLQGLDSGMLSKINLDLSTAPSEGNA